MMYARVAVIRSSALNFAEKLSDKELFVTTTVESIMTSSTIPK